ncbi:MAG TPA: hypothetical protein VKA27_03870 [Sunxiuqinia sp.]|nr:hypothetical protein [Sunxiuqinia sp.]
MKRIYQLTTILFFTAFFTSCYYDNEERLYPNIDSSTNSNCDTTKVTLSQSVMPILQSRCLSCHGKSVANGLGSGVNLETYSELVKYVHNGQLEGAINHSPGYIGMPQGASKLDDCSINKITAWINRGALND